MFEEIDGPFKLIGPTRIGYFMNSFIDHDETARLEQGIHEPIFGADETVAMGANI
jgi:hypothetical protein